ncbi:HAMP domain-containing protein [Paraburkholderia caribensis]|uniref:HAMP domain-containing protein n=1 Tax=Paraburkholderia caribensis TaxID=75105 RepID=UPI001F1931FF|nr:HAMP domain-containing protein [Paraburkholderia caribensis]
MCSHFFFTRSITRPIGLAVSVAQAVAKGDLTSDIRVDRGDETGRLLAALNTMIEKVSEVVYSRPLCALLQSQCCPILHFNTYPSRADDVRGRYVATTRAPGEDFRLIRWGIVRQAPPG